MSDFDFSIIKALVAVLFVVLIDIIFEIILKHKIKEKRKSIKARVRLRYVLAFCLLFFLAKIWVDGFGYLLTIVGFIAAALTITQKEYLMNIFGWLIIMWRDLFVEGEYIEIGKYSGFVRHIGPLYFMLDEASEIDNSDRTGKIIRIPNSFVAVNAIYSYSTEKILVEGKVVVTFTYGSSLTKLRSLMNKISKEVDALLAKKYETATQKEKNYLKRIQEDDSLKIKSFLKFNQDKPLGIQLRIRYYALRKDLKEIENKVMETILHAAGKDDELELSEVL